MLTRALSILLILTSAVLLFFTAMAMADSLSMRDMVQYWAAAQLATSNPYSAEQAYNVEVNAGMPRSRHPMVMPNPPWALPFVLPFRFMSYRVAFASWTLFTLFCVAACARVLWRLYTPRNSLAPAFISLLFGPTLAGMLLGQFSILGLLGITLFLWLVEQRRDAWAGAALLLTVLKPHLLIIFLIVVLLWVIHSRRWLVIVGSAAAFAVACIVAVGLDPQVFQQYFQYAHRFTTEQIPYPNVGGILFLVSRWHKLALLPSMIGTVWALLYWRKHRTNWNMTRHGSFVVLVSLVCTYYSYPYDEVLALPALLGAAALGTSGYFLIGYFLVEIAYAAFFANAGGVTGWDYMILSWVSLALLVTYILSMRKKVTQPGSEPAPSSN